jgi:hypothetical protein
MSATRASESSTHLMSPYIFGSSANKKNLDYLIFTDRLLIKLLNKGRPRVDPCGIFDNVEKGEDIF